MEAKWPMAQMAAVAIAVAGNAFGIILPFIFLPEPHRLVDPLEHAILMCGFSVFGLVVGVPAAIVSRRRHRSLGWVTLLGCLLMYPLDLAAIRVASWVLGIPVSFG